GLGLAERRAQGAEPPGQLGQAVDVEGRAERLGELRERHALRVELAAAVLERARGRTGHQNRPLRLGFSRRRRSPISFCLSFSAETFFFLVVPPWPAPTLRSPDWLARILSAPPGADGAAAAGLAAAWRAPGGRSTVGIGGGFCP